MLDDSSVQNFREWSLTSLYFFFNKFVCKSGLQNQVESFWDFRAQISTLGDPFALNSSWMTFLNMKSSTKIARLMQSCDTKISNISLVIFFSVSLDTNSVLTAKSVRRNNIHSQNRGKWMKKLTYCMSVSQQIEHFFRMLCIVDNFENR